MRDIIKIMDEMIPYATNKENFSDKVEKLKKSVWYTAPENLGLRWRQLHDYMCDDIPENEEDWTEDNYKIVSVFTGMSVADLKKDLKNFL